MHQRYQPRESVWDYLSDSDDDYRDPWFIPPFAPTEQIERINNPQGGSRSESRPNEAREGKFWTYPYEFKTKDIYAIFWTRTKWATLPKTEKRDKCLQAWLDRFELSKKRAIEDQTFRAEECTIPFKHDEKNKCLYFHPHRGDVIQANVEVHQKEEARKVAERAAWNREEEERQKKWKEEAAAKKKEEEDKLAAEAKAYEEAARLRMKKVRETAEAEEKARVAALTALRLPKPKKECCQRQRESRVVLVSLGQHGRPSGELRSN